MYLPRKDEGTGLNEVGTGLNEVGTGLNEVGTGLNEVETRFKAAMIGLDHHLKYKDWHYQKQVCNHDKAKAKNSITKNATKFKSKVAMPEFVNIVEKSASENAKSLKHVSKSKMK